jgi:hypothetical protein
VCGGAWRRRYVGRRVGGGERGLKRRGVQGNTACQSLAYGTLVVTARFITPFKHAAHLQDTYGIAFRHACCALSLSHEQSDSSLMAVPVSSHLLSYP